MICPAASNLRLALQGQHGRDVEMKRTTPALQRPMDKGCSATGTIARSAKFVEDSKDGHDHHEARGNCTPWHGKRMHQNVFIRAQSVVETTPAGCVS